MAPCSDSLSLRLASKLNLAAGQQLAGSFYKRHAVTALRLLRLLAGARFQVLFHSLPGCFSPFPHGTCALSVTGEYSGLDGGPPRFGPGSSCPALLRDASGPRVGVRLRGCHPVPPALPGRSAPPPRDRRARQDPVAAPCNPGGGKHCRARPPAGLAMAPFRSPLLGDLAVDFFSSGYLDVSVPRVVLPLPMGSGGGCRSYLRRVRPFGDPRVVGCVPLTADYRSLPRPSSASCAKASAVRPCYLRFGFAYLPGARAPGDQMLATTLFNLMSIYG